MTSEELQKEVESKLALLRKLAGDVDEVVNDLRVLVYPGDNNDHNLRISLYFRYNAAIEELERILGTLKNRKILSGDLDKTT